MGYISEEADRQLTEKIENFKKENPTEWARLQKEAGANQSEADLFLEGFNDHDKKMQKLRIGKNKWFF